MEKREKWAPARLVLLDAETLGSDLDLSGIENLGDLTVYTRTEPEEVLPRAGQADVIITNKVCFPGELIRELPRPQLIALTATGYNNVDLQAARQANMAVVNVAGYSTESVAQHTFAMLFYLLRGMRRQDDYVRRGEYSRSGLFTWLERPGRELSALQWGLVGMGAMGQRVGCRAEAFGCRGAYTSTSGKNSYPRHPRLPLPELLSTSDVISIHAPLNGTTRGLIGAAELQMMKESALLLNLGRGGIIDETALAAALRKGRPFGAGLDVLEDEPPQPDSPLLRLAAEPNQERLLITPHSAWAAVEARQRLIDETAANIQAFFKEEGRNRLV